MPVVGGVPVINLRYNSIQLNLFDDFGIATKQAKKRIPTRVGAGKFTDPKLPGK